jgi:hypothetical protein
MTIGRAAAVQQGDAAENVITLNLTERHIRDKPATLEQKQEEQRGGKRLRCTITATRHRLIKTPFGAAGAN